MQRWRVGRKVTINVYEGDAPVCQCHTPEMAQRIVDAMNNPQQIVNMDAEWRKAYHILEDRAHFQKERADAAEREVAALREENTRLLESWNAVNRTSEAAERD